MLLQFSVTNHRSIRNKITVSFAATTDTSLSDSLISPDGKKKLLPVIAVYGANAAGKTNVIHALSLMKSMVAGENAKPLKDTLLPQEPFAYATEDPTTLEAIYYYDGIKYAYGFSFTKEKIIKEYLYHWRRGREGLIFLREYDHFTFRENIAEQSVLSGRTPDNRLYLVTSNEWNSKDTRDAYLWFTRKLVTLPRDADSYEKTLTAISTGKEQILREMEIADLGIVDIRVTGNKKAPVVLATHRLENEDGLEGCFDLPINQESHGTQQFFSRIGSWLDVLNNSGVLVVDELESSIHPLLTRHLIETMQDKNVNKQQAQLIFTTHDDGLLDQTLLRRDQIWFAERNEKTAETDVFALTDFSPRKGENIRKGYLQGRFGAVPFIGGAKEQD